MRYSRHYRRRQRAWVPYVAVAALLLLAAYWAGNRIGGPDRAQRGPDEPDTEPGNRVVAAGPPEDRITSGTEFVYVTQYASTGRTERQTATAPETMMDLTREALAVLYPQWEIETFSPEQVVFRRTDNGLDPTVRTEEEERFRTLAIRDDRIVVLRGRPHPTAGIGLDDLPLLRETGISTASLLADDAERLSAGVIVEGDDEVARSLEGYLN